MAENLPNQHSTMSNNATSVEKLATRASSSTSTEPTDEDFVEMEQILQDMDATKDKKATTSPEYRSAYRKSDLVQETLQTHAQQQLSPDHSLDDDDEEDGMYQVTIPQNRVSRKLGVHLGPLHNRRRAGSSQMGSMVINVQLKFPEMPTIITEHSDEKLDDVRTTVAEQERTNNLALSPSPIKTDEDNEAVPPQIEAAPQENDEMIEKKDTLTFADPMEEIIEILKKPSFERGKIEVDILVKFFENFEIMTEDVDPWSGQHTFRAFIQQTKYKHVKFNEYVYRKGDNDANELCFYFILRGNVKLSKSEMNLRDAAMSTSSAAAAVEVVTDLVIDLAENHIFGEAEMLKSEARDTNCVCCALNGVHLAYWDKATYDEYIGMIKTLNSRIEEDGGLLHDKHGVALTEADLIEKASMFLDDAMKGRDFKLHRNGKWPKKIHRFLNSEYLNYFFVLITCGWLSCIWLEPPSTLKDNAPQSTHYPHIMTLIGYEWLVFAIYCIECLLRFYSFGSRWFFSLRLHTYRVLLLLIFLCDLLTATILRGHSFRFSRILRPFFLMLFIADLRRQYFILISCIPAVVELIMLYLTIVGIFARLGYHIFDWTNAVYNRSQFVAGDGVYEHYLDGWKNLNLDDETSPRADDLLYNQVWHSFETFFLSSNTLFALLTTENYPDVMWPAWLSSHTYWGYFALYILISTFFLMNLFSASVFNAYGRIIHHLDLLDEKRESQALQVAWNCLDYQRTGYIKKDKFEKLMMRLKPHYSKFEIDVLFKLMDPNEDGQIDVEEFSMMMINCLYLSISKRVKSREEELNHYLHRLGNKLGKHGYAILSVFRSKYYEYLVLSIISVDVFALLSYHQFPVLCNWTDFICVYLIILNIPIDIIFKHQGRTRRYFQPTKNKIFFVITIIQCIGSTLGFIDLIRKQQPHWQSGFRFFGFSRILIIASVLRERFSFLRTNISNTLTQTIIYMIPVFLRICFYLFAGFVYMFAVIGMEIFYNWQDPSTWGRSRCDGAQQLVSNPYASFCDASATFITLFQILTTNDWHILMYTAIDVTGSWFVAIYFVLFFILGPILIVNFLLAVFFDMFSHVQEHQQENQSSVEAEFASQSPQNAENAPPGNVTKSVTVRKMTDNFSNPTTDSVVEEDTNNAANGESARHLHNIAEIPLITAAKKLWQELAVNEYADDNGNRYLEVFTGRAAVQCMLNELQYVANEEEAVKYLKLMMDEEGVFERIDVTTNNEFVDDENAHYQWIAGINEVDEEKQAGDDHDTNNEEVLIDLKRSYGGFQRMMKHKRKGAAQTVDVSAADTETPNTTRITRASSVTRKNDTGTPPVSKAPFTPTAKSNPFSTRNLLSYQSNHSNNNSVNAVQHEHDSNSNQHQRQQTNGSAAKENEYEMSNALVVLLGDMEHTEIESAMTEYSNVFEQTYHFSVLKAADLSSMTVSKYFNVDKYDAVILILNKVAFSARAIYRLLANKLGIENVDKIPKLVVAVKDEFSDDGEEQDVVVHGDENGDEEDEEEQDLDERLSRLFGIVETKHTEFNQQFAKVLGENYDQYKRFPLITMVNEVQNELQSNVCLKRFDPLLLLYKITKFSGK